MGGAPAADEKHEDSSRMPTQFPAIGGSSGAGAAQAHCQRVAAVADEIAAGLGLSSAERELLAGAAATHHYPIEFSLPRTTHRLLCDLFSDELAANRFAPQTRVLTGEELVVALFQGRCAAAGIDPSLYRLAQVLDVANVFIEQIEGAPYERKSSVEIIHAMNQLAADGFLESELVGELARWSKVTTDSLALAARRLPAFPAVALKVLSHLDRPGATADVIQRLAQSDQVLAASLVSVANSVLYASSAEITSVSRAIARIGTDAARKVILTACLKPLLASSVLRDLWIHSIEVAADCEQLARTTRRADPDEALLAGLIHDLGRLVIQMLPQEFVARHTRLERVSGCSLLADYLVCGQDHGAIGAHVLASWNLPAHITAAIRDHHQPERSESALCSLLYLAEHRSAAEEDIPSSARLSGAMKLLGIRSLEHLTSLSSENLPLRALARAV
jgi:putative nucleotidyltransferase with HDIG domain